MNQDIEIMIKNYNTFDFDWMGEVINSTSSLTRHHIIKKENGGEDDKSNYALLTESSHHLIHFMEINYNENYNTLNRLFLELNRSENPPTEEYYETVRKIVKNVRKCIKNSNRRRKK